MSGGFFLLRRSGSLWAAPESAVAGIERTARGVRLRLVEGGALEADQVSAVDRDLPVRALGAVMRAWWNQPVRGLAVYRGEPCVVIDTARPPLALGLREEES